MQHHLMGVLRQFVQQVVFGPGQVDFLSGHGDRLEISPSFIQWAIAIWPMLSGSVREIIGRNSQDTSHRLGQGSVRVSFIAQH